MKATITNTSRALQGVHNAAGGLTFIDTKQTREVDVADDYVERVKALPFFTTVWADPLDHDGDGTKGGAKPALSERDALKARATELKIEFAGNIATAKLKELVDAKEAEAKPVDEMTDDELKTFLGAKGVTVTDETREQLLELAKAA